MAGSLENRGKLRELIDKFQFVSLPFERGETPFSKGFSVICLPIYQSIIDLATKTRYNKSIQAGGLAEIL